MPYIRRGAQSLPVDTPQARRRLEFAKGIASFEDEVINIETGILSTSEITAKFISNVVPSSTPDRWLRKQNLIRTDRPTVAGVLMFADEPQAALPKRCGIKVYRLAVSNLKCNTRPLDFIVEHFLGSSESEACAWPRVEAGGDFFEIAV